MTPTRAKSQTASRSGDATPGQATVRGQPRVRVDLGRRKQISLGADAPSFIYTVESGCLTLDATLADERRQILLMLYPGEMISKDFVPPVRQATLTAIQPSVVWRVPAPEAGLTALQDEVTAKVYGSAINRLIARSSLHAIMIGRLTGEERLAALLIEMALFLGTPAAGGYTFELPLTRDDMADYLALNPDTLSRMISKLKSRHLLSMPSRHRVIIKDFNALLNATPLADAFEQLHSGAVRA